MKRILCAAAISLLCLAGPAGAQSSFEDIWNKARPDMSECAELILSHDDGKRSALDMVTFRDSKFDRLLEHCIGILADSDATDLIRQHDAAAKKKAKLEAKIRELAEKRAFAPEESHNPFKPDRASLKRDMEECRQEIDAVQAEFDAKKNAVYDAIRGRGVQIEREQFDQLISAADGPDQAKIMAVAENLKLLQQKLQETSREAGSSTGLLQTYAGICMMCHRVYMHAIEDAMDKIDNTYMPRLSALRKENDKLMEDSAALLRRASSPEEKAVLEKNIESQKHNEEVIVLYRKYLQGRMSRCRDLHRTVEKKFSVAENTYRTIRLSSQLVEMIKATDTDFTRLFSFQPPELSQLYDARLREEFAQVTAILRKDD